MEAFFCPDTSSYPEITLFLNPETESYLRLGEDKAPKYICYSQQPFRTDSDTGSQ